MHSYPQHQMVVSGQLQNFPALPPVHIDQKTGRVSELIWTLWRRKEFVSLPGNEPRFLGRSAHSPTLYRLSSPGSIYWYYRHWLKNVNVSSAPNGIQTVQILNGLCFSQRATPGRNCWRPFWRGNPRKEVKFAASCMGSCLIQLIPRRLP
jgi:hypothetical protein